MLTAARNVIGRQLEGCSVFELGRDSISSIQGSDTRCLEDVCYRNSTVAIQINTSQQKKESKCIANRYILVPGQSNAGTFDFLLPCLDEYAHS